MAVEEKVDTGAIPKPGDPGAVSAPAGWQILIWSGTSFYVPADQQVYKDGRLVWADSLPLGTTIDAEQYAGFEDRISNVDEGEPSGSPWAVLPAEGTTPSTHDSGIAQTQQAVGSQVAQPAAPGAATPSTHDSSIPGPGAIDAFDWANATDAEIEEKIRTELGFLAWMLDIPELHDLVFRGIREGWTAEAIQAGLQNTNWWRTTEPQMRELARLRAEDPAYISKITRDVVMDLRLEAMRLGVSLPDDVLNSMAEEALTFGWVDLQGNPSGNLLMQAILNEAVYKPQDLQPGALAVSVDELQRTAEDWMVPISADAAAIWAERIQLGETDMAAFTVYMQGLAKSRFPHLAGIIDQGISPRSHFEPYRQQVASLLEVNPDEVDLFGDPRFAPIVETQTDQGVRAMTLAETQQYIRRMPEWGQTVNGLTTTARTLEAFLSAMGEGG